MKNYYLTKTNAPSDFILKYEIKNDKIIVYCEDGEIVESEYDQELEQDILNYMENELENISFYNLKEMLKQNVQKNKDISIATSCICILSFITNFVSEIPLTFTESTPVTIITALGTAVSLVKQNRYKALIKDLNKNHRFIANKDLFTKMSKAQKEFVLSKQPLKVRKVLSQKGDININTIDELSKNEITNLINTARETQKTHVYKK